MVEKTQEYYQRLVSGIFLNDKGESFKMTGGQADIFRLIVDPDILRVAIKTYTQYGKSDVASMAVAHLLSERIEKILIIAPSTEQARIIMNNVIQHLFDFPTITAMLDYEGSLEILKRERSKKRLTLKHGSEVFILTANAREVSAEARNIMGFGATIIIIDESPLIPDVMYGKILRMAGSANRTRKIIQLGNAFDSVHFRKAFKSKRYFHLTIDYKQGIEEGRIKESFIEEAKENMTPLEFKILYESEFPKEGAVNSLIPADWVELAIEQKVSAGEKRGGLDVARFGDDKTVYCSKNGGYARFHKTEHKDTMEVVGWARNIIDDEKPDKTAVDTVGIGSGVFDRLNEAKVSVSDVNVGASPMPVGDFTEKDIKKKFYNLKSQMLWALRDWFKPKDGKSDISIPNDPDLIKQLKEIRYNYDSAKRIKIESKEDMKKRIGKSPDELDALMLAFCDLTDTELEVYIG